MDDDRLRAIAAEAWRRYPGRMASDGDARRGYVRWQLMGDLTFVLAAQQDTEHGTDSMDAAINGLLAEREPHGS
ncbi:MAG TPA: hypothetical protein VFL55_00375 [Acetobacteraceae bacterium]|nr:hypothetical protein [Acetobacteraceae bacterium]